MAAPGWIEQFVRRLEALELRYMVTGSVASMIYGEPRLTLDVDLVVELDVERAEELLAAFRRRSSTGLRSKSCASSALAMRAVTST